MQFKLKDFLKSNNITRQSFYKLQGTYGIVRISRGVYEVDNKSYSYLKTWYVSKKKMIRLRRQNVKNQ